QHPHLVTLTGAGGTGKTRRALEAARALLHDFPDGVFVVELASLTDPKLIASPIASVRPDRTSRRACRSESSLGTTGWYRLPWTASRRSPSKRALRRGRRASPRRPRLSTKRSASCPIRPI